MIMGVVVLFIGSGYVIGWCLVLCCYIKIGKVESML